MKTLLYLVILVTLITNCKKDEPLQNGPKTIVGKIVSDCSLTPLANSPIRLLISESQALSSSDLSIYDFTSDANGNFSYTLNNPPSSFTSELRFGGTSIKGVVPKSTESKNLGTLIATPTANFVVKLKVNNSYGVGDTLFIKDFSTMTNVKIPGPFSDYTFNTTYSFSDIQNRTLTNKNFVEVSTGIILYNGTLYTSSYNELSRNKFEKLILACTGMVDTLLIEIN